MITGAVRSVMQPDVRKSLSKLYGEKKFAGRCLAISSVDRPWAFRTRHCQVALQEGILWLQWVRELIAGVQNLLPAWLLRPGVRELLVQAA